jgi:sugar lactone lactonase YvrE
MTLEQLGAGIDFVSDSPPANATDGDTLLDTSLSPPEVKVFDGSVGSFVTPQTAQNLDQKVSNAGADLRFRSPFQISTASFLLNFNPLNQEQFPTAVAFSDAGGIMYVTGVGSSSVHQYSLSAPFEVNSASFSGSSFSVSGQEGRPQGISINNDGKALFAIGTNSSSVHQYSLSAPFEVNSASFSGSSFDVSGEESSPRDVAFNNDGTSMFVIGNSSDQVHQYSLSTGFDISTASFVASFFVGGQDSSPEGIAFNGDGGSMFVTGSGSNQVYQYSLSTGFDISTLSFTGTTFDVSGQETSSKDVSFSTDGHRMYVIGNSGNRVQQYLIGTVARK